MASGLVATPPPPAAADGTTSWAKPDDTESTLCCCSTLSTLREERGKRGPSLPASLAPTPLPLESTRCDSDCPDSDCETECEKERDTDTGTRDASDMPCIDPTQFASVALLGPAAPLGDASGSAPDILMSEGTWGISFRESLPTMVLRVCCVSVEAPPGLAPPPTLKGARLSAESAEGTPIPAPRCACRSATILVRCSGKPAARVGAVLAMLLEAGVPPAINPPPCGARSANERLSVPPTLLCAASEALGSTLCGCASGGIIPCEREPCELGLPVPRLPPELTAAPLSPRKGGVCPEAPLLRPVCDAG